MGLHRRSSVSDGLAGESAPSGPSSDRSIEPMHKKAASIPWVRLGVEMSAIIFSVLLALVLDDWRQNRDARDVVDAVMLSLRVELERNQRVLEASLPYHEAMLDTFRVRLAELEERASATTARAQSLDLQPLDRLGFQQRLGIGASLATGAWEAARASGAMTRVGIDELFLLSAAYATQGQVDRALLRLADDYDRYVEAVVNRERSLAALIGFTSALSDVVEREVELCTTYRTLARRLTGTEPDPARRCGSGNVTIR